MVGCEDKPASPTPTPAQDKKAQDTKSEPAKPDMKPSETTPGDKAGEGDTKPAKGIPSPEDLKLLTEKTEKLMAALKAKDANAIAEFVPEAKREDAKKDFAADGKAYKSFFGDGEWRANAITTWDNKVHMIRIKDDKARVKVGEIADKKEAAVVEWSKQDAQWFFEDMQSPSLEDYATWGEELK
jgi:hypothetical protein